MHIHVRMQQIAIIRQACLMYIYKGWLCILLKYMLLKGIQKRLCALPHEYRTFLTFSETITDSEHLQFQCSPTEKYTYHPLTNTVPVMLTCHTTRYTLCTLATPGKVPVCMVCVTECYHTKSASREHDVRCKLSTGCYIKAHVQ